jgi:hypothetical protein
VWTETAKEEVWVLKKSGLVIVFNPLNTELYPICHLLALSGAHYIFHLSGLRVKVINMK